MVLLLVPVPCLVVAPPPSAGDAIHRSMITMQTNKPCAW